MSIKLRDKFIGCIAGCHIGSSMGAVPEGMTWQSLKEKYGYLDKLLPFAQGMNMEIFKTRENTFYYGPAGTTEDGVERQRLMILAVRDKNGRVTANDIRDSWVKYMNPGSFGKISMQFEEILYMLAKAGIPGGDIGHYCDYSGLNSFARACHPIGLINAGNIKTAIEDTYDTGRLYQMPYSRGLDWACVTTVSIASATLPDATLDSMFQAVFDNCAPRVVNEIKTGLEKTADCKDIIQMRERFDDIYNSTGLMFGAAQAQEVVTKGLCIVKMVNANTKEAILAGVNMGRDTDCVTAIAGGIAGALTGWASIPTEWIEQVDKATKENPYTCSQMTIEGFADAVYNAYQARLDEEAAFVQTMKGA